LKETAIRPKNILERNLLREENTNFLSRDAKGRFIARNSELGRKTNKKEEESTCEPREIKLVKVKGTFGTFIVVERKSWSKRIINENILNHLIIFLFASLITKVLFEQLIN
jgi:hypothetical protein